MRLPPLALALVAAGALCACGKQGELDRPPPLVGAAKDNDYTAKRPVTPQENYDPASSNRSPRSAPISGTEDPIGRPPSLTPP
jgi:predicted small lipoprotein YifL